MKSAPLKTCDYCGAIGTMPTFMDGETICSSCMSKASTMSRRSYLDLLQKVEQLERKNAIIVDEANRESLHNRQLRIDRFKEFNGEECWIYSNDEFDNLETLVCPVVIKPAELLEIINERNKLRAQLSSTS